MRLVLCLMMALGWGACAPPAATVSDETAPTVSDETAPTVSDETAPTTVAFVDVNVVPMDRERVLMHQTVIVRGERIAHIGATSRTPVPHDAVVIDGQGGYLIPGLVDMHVHVSENELLLYLANGVTTIRNMNGDEGHLALRARIATGSVEGPTLYTAGPLVTDSSTSWRIKAVPETTEEARRIVREQKERGYDFVKVYDGLSKRIYVALIDEAHKVGLRPVGHIPASVGLEGVLQAGQVSLEHVEKIVYSFFGHGFDEDRIPEAAALIREADTWVCPTLAVQEIFMWNAEGRFSEMLNRPEVQYVDPEYLAWWHSFARPPAHQDATASQHEPRSRSFYAFQLALTRVLHEAGVPLLAGTDAPNPGMVPGFSLHEELRNLVNAGLSPYEALAAATRNAADFLQALSEVGTVAVGKRADLVLLKENPLKDITQTKNRIGVMWRGEWVPQAAWQRRLDHLAASLDQDAQQ